MTGIVKSAGCKVCKQRRIKCDETTPQCLRCQKIGRACPGPDPQFRFIQQQRQIAGQTEGSRSSGKNRSKPEPLPFLVKQQKRAQDGGLYQTMEILPGSSKWEKKVAAFPQGLQMTDADNLASSLVEIMKSTPDGQGLSISMLADFFTFIPSRVGHNRTLDAAVACVVQGQRFLARRRLNDQESRDESAYLKALRNLQLSLDDPRERSSAETLCGALVVAQYELLRPKSPNEIQWLAHAGGAAAILQARGSDSYTTEFEQSMLLAHHGSVVSCSIFQGIECYLNSDEWLSALERSLGELPITNALVNADRLFHSTLHAIGTLPELIHQLRALGPSTSTAEHHKLLQAARQFKAQLLALAPLHEAEFFDGETVVQRAFDHSESRINQQQVLFPPPLQQMFGEIDPKLHIHYSSPPDDCAVRQLIRPELLTEPLRVDYSSRYAAKRHLIYWTAVILSNIILLRLNSTHSRGDSDDLSHCNDANSCPDSCHDYRRHERNFGHSQTTSGTLDHVTEKRASPNLGQSTSNIDWNSWKRTKVPDHEMDHYHSAASMRNRSGFIPLIPVNFDVPKSMSHAVPSPSLSQGLPGSENSHTEVTSYCEYLNKNLEISFLPAQNPQLPSPPEEFPQVQGGLDLRLSSPYPESNTAEGLAGIPANIDIHRLTLPSSHPQASPPHTFLTSPTISPYVQNAYLHSLILRSLPYVHRDKPLGALYILFPFQMAAAISTPAQKEWIAAALTDMFSDLHLTFSRDKTWTAPTFMDDVDQIARDAGIFYGERPR